LDEARDAFAQELNVPSRPRDQAGRFVATPSKPEAIFQPRPVEGGDDGDTSDAGPDPRFVEQERRIADGRVDERDEGRRQSARADAAQHHDAAPDGQRAGGQDDEPPERIGAEADAAGQDDEGADKRTDAEGNPIEDAGPRYKVQVDGQEVEVSLGDALKTYAREETFNRRVAQMVEVAKSIDQRGQEAVRERDAYINMCRQQEQEFAALIPQEPKNWDELYRQNPQQAHELEKNYRVVYGTLNTIRSRRQAAEQQAANDTVRRTAEYARSEFDRFCSKNKLATQADVDKALGYMRRTAAAHGFSEDEIGTTYDERMLSVLHKAAKYDNIIAQRPVAVQPDKGNPLSPGSAPRVGDARGRQMNDAQKRLAASGRIDDAAAVMAQLIRR
jgi:hypothetical protein